MVLQKESAYYLGGKNPNNYFLSIFPNFRLLDNEIIKLFNEFFSGHKSNEKMVVQITYVAYNL